MNRYAAKLLYQFRVRIGSRNGRLRTCEESIILIDAPSAKAALAIAKRRGKVRRSSYLNSDGNRVYFEFVGILGLIALGSECQPDEVWYDIKNRMLPMERKASILPDESTLSAIRNEHSPANPGTGVRPCNSAASSRRSSRR